MADALQYSQLGQFSRSRAVSAFRPGVLPSVIVLLLLPCLIALGFWQLARAEEKRQLLALYQAQQSAAPIALNQLEQLTDPAYRRVQLHGYFDAQHSLLLDNRLRDGRAGVEVLQPFYDQPSGLWLLVNRGWQAWPDRRVPPQFNTPDSPLQLTAWVYVALAGGLHLSGASDDKSWPRLISEVQPQSLWQQLGRGGFRHELRLEAGPAALRTDWPVIAMGVEKHQGYAVQWFAMAGALFALFIYFGIHNARETRHATSHRPA
jgi:surfeit locus 1 family protein